MEVSRSSIPHPSNNIETKTPEDNQVIVTKSIIPNTMFTNIPAPAVVEKKSVTEEGKRQFIPSMQLNSLFYPQYQQYQVPQYANFMQYAPINVQQSAIQQAFRNDIVQPVYSPSIIQSQAQQSVAASSMIFSTQ